MAVQEADKALDEWLKSEVDRIKGLINISVGQIRTAAFRGSSITQAINSVHYYTGCLRSLQDTQRQLHEFWGASLVEVGDDKAETGRQDRPPDRH